VSLASLRALLAPRALLDLAGAPSLARGTGYHRDGRVTALAEADDAVTAEVVGSEIYHVRLWDAAGRVGYDCECPVGRELRFCKHCVAVALSWTAPEITADAAVAAPSRRSGSDDEVRSFLERQSREELLALMLDNAAENKRLRATLKLRAAAGGDGGAPNLKRFRQAVDAAFRTGDFVDYGRAGSYAGRIMSVIGEVRALLDTAPGALVELMEHAAAKAERAIENVDDSDGYFTEIFAAIGELHLEACERARPDPVALARRLFESALHGGYDVFAGVEAYAEVLGADGLAEYRRRAEAEWEKVPALGPGERGGPDRFNVTQIMEALARLEGGVEPLVRVRRRDLSSGCQFLKIAEHYRDWGDPDQAVAWAEAGLAAFPGNPDGRLRTFLAGVHQEQGRHAEALELVWAELSDRPGLEEYKRLKECAGRAGVWPEWRARALALVRERADAQAALRASRPGWAVPHPDSGYSTLVRILLWEGRIEEAWREAGQGGCSEALWFELARKREAGHPADAIPIYQRRIDAEVSGGSNRGYETAVRLLLRLGELYLRAERAPGDFTEHLAALRNTYRRKRNFIKLMDAAPLR
jgi:uncharacterized Zn finger protein